MNQTHLPLQGVRILDMATVVAAPLGATLCADLGADTVKLELPSGTDTLRSLAPVIDGKPVWWKVANRGKRGISLDVRKEVGRAIFLRLLARFDVLVENFRTGTMAGWGLDSETLFAANPKLIIVRVTGFGQTGPYANRPGFARVFEAMTSFTSLTAGADGSPLHADFPMGDAVAGLYTAFTIASEVARLRGDPDAKGREIDLSASEALMRLLDPIPAEFGLLGTVRRPKGSSASYTAPSNIYQSKDGVYFSMAASSDEMFRRLASGFNKDWLSDSRFEKNKDRMNHTELLNGMVSNNFLSLPFSEIQERLDSIAVPYSKVNTIEDAMKDDQFQDRQVFMKIEDSDFGEIPTICVVPRAIGFESARPRSGPNVGEHNADIFKEIGIDSSELWALKESDII